jgi:two-component system phosphate regulon sensor histidine kinase PhoR
MGEGVLLFLTDLTELNRLRTVRTEFVANVSHELRTPLASIRATAETLLDGAISDPEYSKRFLETIIREADRLVQLADDLLELSRAESNRRIRERFDLRGLVLEVAARLMGQAERRTIALKLPPLVAPPVWVDADRSELDQVFFNLFDNAIKYTPGGGRVTIGVDVRPAEHRVAVRVADTGIGILSQDLPRIFERFWRADRARRFQSSDEGAGTTGGTGLGLSIVKHIVEAHGGVVTAESELGQGSCFTVLLPLAPLDDTPAQAGPNEEDKD